MRAAFDFETWEWVNPLCCGFAWGPPGERKYHYIHDRSGKKPQAVAQAALRYMASRPEVKSWWAHNGGRFDAQFLLRAAVDLGWNADAHVSGGRAIQMTFRAPGAKLAVHVNDSMAMMSTPRSLKTCAEDFQLPSKEKIFTADDYSIDTRKWEPGRLRDGCLRDCELVLELLERLETLVEDWGGELRSTFSGTALTMVRADLESKGIEFPRHDKGEMPEVNLWCRNGYYGGRVEVLNHAPKSLLTEWDVCSSYPWSMTQALPWQYLGSTTSKRGLARMLEGERAGIIEAEVIVPSMHIPPLPYRAKEGGIYFPTGKWRGHWPSVELAYAQTQGVKVKPLEGHAYTVESPFHEFVSRVYQVKRTAPKGALRAFAKDTLNGCYGKFSQAPEREVLMLMADAEEADAYIESQPPGTVGQLDSEDPRFLTRETFRWNWQTHYALASFVTAHSRIKLHKAMAEATGLAYVDTDAIHAAKSGVQEGSDLGSWKVELADYEAVFWAPKIYELHKGDKHIYAAKGFTIDNPEKFRALVRCESLQLGDRNRLVRTQFRRKGVVVRVPEIKRWGGRSRKRKPLDSGMTLPWDVEEIIRGMHNEALSPLVKGK